MKQCKGLTKWEYPGTFYSPSETMFDRIKSCGIGVQDAFFPWFIVYDFEVILQKEPCRVSDKLKWEARHVPVSVCSNVEGFREPRCFVGGDLKKLLKDMLSYMTEIGRVICELALLKWGHILDQIKEVSIREKFETYLQEIPVLGFNSGKYDMNLMKTEIVQLLELEQKSNYFVIKKNNSYMCLSDKNFRFLDISNFLAPGCSYSKFLKAFQISESKFYFPSEWFDDEEKLDWTHLPPPDAFYSSLKVQNTLGETESDITKNYAFLQKVWKEENMRTFQDFFNLLQQFGCGTLCQSR